MIRNLGKKQPKIARSAFVSEAAYVVGDVEIGEDSSVWPGAVIRADMNPVRIGKNTHVEDTVVIHGGLTPITIGDNVVIGHCAMVHAETVGDNVLIGINSALLHRVEIGNRCIIAGGAVVPDGMKVPDGSFVAGVPAEIKGEISEKHLVWIDGTVASSYVELAREYKEAKL
ncbi:MAG: Carbonic anhydrase precursor [Candidatus Syntrophoarchaeum sp. GoM_oil]|nr:MAG: Carbonic anhydrase precursor [Candidatus Syntrophoarchaeum sp. GoM_oil]